MKTNTTFQLIKINIVFIITMLINILFILHIIWDEYYILFVIILSIINPVAIFWLCAGGKFSRNKV